MGILSDKLYDLEVKKDKDLYENDDTYGYKQAENKEEKSNKWRLLDKEKYWDELDTKPEEIEPLLKEVDLVLVMSVEPGFGGQSFLESAYDKVKYLKNYKDIHHLNYYIEVDGGVNDVTGPKLLEIGTDVLVTGSYLMKGNPEDNLKKLNKYMWLNPHLYLSLNK